jgi:hypothetical protein
VAVGGEHIFGDERGGFDYTGGDEGGAQTEFREKRRDGQREEAERIRERVDIGKLGLAEAALVLEAEAVDGEAVEGPCGDRRIETSHERAPSAAGLHAARVSVRSDWRANSSRLAAPVGRARR